MVAMLGVPVASERLETFRSVALLLPLLRLLWTPMDVVDVVKMQGRSGGAAGGGAGKGGRGAGGGAGGAGAGGGGGAGRGAGRGGAGGGRMGGYGLGPGGECVCPNCGHRIPHRRGVPCAQEICPKCGTRMTRAM